MFKPIMLIAFASILTGCVVAPTQPYYGSASVTVQPNVRLYSPAPVYVQPVPRPYYRPYYRPQCGYYGCR